MPQRFKTASCQTRPAQIRDGLSNTLLVGERLPAADAWYAWWYAGVGQQASGSPDMLLGALELNQHTNYCAADCPEGPYQFGSGKVDQQCSLFHYWSHHAGGANFAFCDGSVRFVAYDISPEWSVRSISQPDAHAESVGKFRLLQLEKGRFCELQRGVWDKFRLGTGGAPACDY